jgi:hypothetical protein
MCDFFRTQATVHLAPGERGTDKARAKYVARQLLHVAHETMTFIARTTATAAAREREYREACICFADKLGIARPDLDQPAHPPGMLTVHDFLAQQTGREPTAAAEAELERRLHARGYMGWLDGQPVARRTGEA